MTHARCTPHGAEATCRKPGLIVATFVLGMFVLQPSMVAANPADGTDGESFRYSGGGDTMQFGAWDTAGTQGVPASSRVEPAGTVAGDFSRVGFDASGSTYAARFVDTSRFTDASGFPDGVGFPDGSGFTDAVRFTDAARFADPVDSVDPADSDDFGARLRAFAEAGLAALLVTGLLILAGINGLKRPPGSERRLPRGN